MAVHVEDHPIEYFDFEGVIPHGEYGGGDVIVWDSGTWEPHGTDDPAAAVAAGELHADVHGQKLRGRLVLVRRGERTCRQGAVAAAAQARHVRRRAGIRRTTRARCSAAGPTTRCGRPGAVWRSDLPPAQASSRCDRPRSRPDRRRARGPGRARAGGHVEVFGRELRVTNLDKELFPGRGRRAAGDQAGADPLHGPDRARRAALPGRPAAEHAPLPRRRDRPRASGTSSSRRMRPSGCPVATTPTPIPARAGPTSWSTSRRRWCGRRTSARWSGTRGRRAPTPRTSPT